MTHRPAARSPVASTGESGYKVTVRRPWYTYLLLFIGIVAMLAALAPPAAGVAAMDPGGLVLGPQRRLFVRPGSPLSRSGARSGDRFVSSEVVELPGKG